MQPMAPSEFEHSAASEQFEDYDQYLRHHKAREQTQTAAANSRMAADTHYLTGICIFIAVLIAFDEMDPIRLPIR